MRFGEAQERADAIDAEPQLAAAPDEGEALPVRGLVEPVPAFRASRFRHQADPLVVPDGLEVHAAQPGELADRQPRQDMESLAKPQEGVDSLKGKFGRPTTDIPGVTAKLPRRDGPSSARPVTPVG